MTLYGATSLIVLHRLLIEGGVINYGDINWIVNTNPEARPFYCWFRQVLLGTNVFRAYGEATQLPYQLAIWGLSTLTSPHVSQFAFLWFIFTLSGVSMYLMLKKYVGMTEVGPILGGMMYMFNPVSVYRFPASPFLFLQYAIFPLAIMTFDQAIEKPGRKTIFNAAMVISASAWAILGSFPVMLMALGLLLLMKILVTRSLRGALSIFKSTLKIIGLFLLLNSFWILPAVTSLLTEGTAFSQVYSSEETASLNSRSHFLNSIRLLGYWWEAVQPIEPAHQPFKLAWVLLSFTIPVMAFGYFVMSRRWIDVYFFVSGVFFLFLNTGLNSPLPQFYEYLVRNIPSFRDPYKFAVPISLSYSYALGAFINSYVLKADPKENVAAIKIKGKPRLIKPLSRTIDSFTVRRGMCIVLLVFLVFGNGWPLIINDQMSSLTPVEYPHGFYAINHFLAEDNEEFRVLWLPLRTGALFKWSPNKYHWMTDPALFSSSKPSLGYSFIEPSSTARPLDFVRYVYENIVHGKTVYAGKMLSITGTKYVVFRDDVLPINSIDLAPTDQILKQLYAQGDLSLVKQENGYYVFLNEVPAPVVRLADLGLLAIGDVSVYNHLVSSELLDLSRIVLFFWSQQKNGTWNLFHKPLLFYNRDLRDLASDPSSLSTLMRYLDKNRNGLAFIIDPKSYAGVSLSGLSPRSLASASKGVVLGKFPVLQDNFHDKGGWSFANDAHVSFDGSLKIKQIAGDFVNDQVSRSVHPSLDSYRLRFSFRVLTTPSNGKYTILFVALYENGWHWWITIDKQNVYLSYHSPAGDIKVERISAYDANCWYDLSATFNGSLQLKLNDQEIKVYDILPSPLNGVSFAQITGPPAEPFVDGEFEVTRLYLDRLQPAHLFFNLHIPVSDEYFLALRYVNASGLSLSIDDSTLFKMPDSTGTSIDYWSTKTWLSQGIHRFQILIENSGGIDDIFLIDTQLFNKIQSLAHVKWETNAHIVYRKIDPTRWSIRVNHSTPQYLFFAETYSPWWKAKLNGERLESQLANYFGNAFYLNKTGETNVELVFELQTFMLAGEIISFSSFVVYTIYVYWGMTRSTNFRRRRTKPKGPSVP